MRNFKAIIQRFRNDYMQLKKNFATPLYIIFGLYIGLTIVHPFYYFLAGYEIDPVMLFLLIISPIVLGFILFGFRSLIEELIEIRKREELISADKLSRSEEMLRAAQKIASIGYWEEFIINGEVNFSEEFYDILELDPEERESDKKEILSRLHSSEGCSFNRRKDELFNYGNFECEYRYVTYKGNVKFIFERYSLLKVKGINSKIIGVVQDVTERILAEQRTIQSEQYYKRLFDGARDAVILFYPENEIIIDVNKRACEIYGFTREEFIGKSLVEISKYPDIGAERVLETLKRKQFWQFQTTQFAKDRRELHFEITASVMEFYGEEVILSINRDITATKETEDKIRLLSMGIEQHPSPIVITDVEGNIEYVNHAFEAITGYAFGEVIGKNPRIIQSGETPKELYTEMWDTIKSGREWRGEFRNKKKDGTFYWEYAVIYPVRDSGNNIKQFFASKLDITERKELEFQLKLYRERLEFLVDQRTKRLKESEETFRALTENSNDVIMRFNDKIEHIYVNPAAEKLLGIQDVKLIGKSYSQLGFTESVFIRWEEAIRKVFLNGRENSVELLMTDGRWFDCRLYPEYDNEGNIVSVITSSRDITELKRTERDLYRKEKLLRGVAEASNKLLALDSFYNRINSALEIIGKAADVDRVYIFENRRNPETKELYASQIYEWAAQSVSPQIDNPALQELKIDESGLHEAFKKLSAGQHWMKLTNEMPVLARQIMEEQGIKSLLAMPVEIGGTFWGFVGFDECKYERVWDDGELAILKILASDVGGAFTRKLIEDALMNTEERFKALFDYAPISYFIVDPEGYFIDANNSLEKTFGYSKREIAELQNIFNFKMSKEDKKALEKVLSDGAMGVAAEPVEMDLYHKEGKKIVIELNTFPITLADKRMVLCALHDVSLRKENEMEIRKALMHSQELNEIKSRFVSMVSHEFRTPLSTILSSVEILKLFEARLREEEKEGHFRKITKSIDYLTNLLDDVITINRADSGRLVVKFHSFDVIPLLEQWVLDIRASFVESPEIEFVKHRGELRVELDENLFRQIVSNLLNNAIKYTPATGRIILSAEKDGEWFTLKIADSGIGIPSESRQDIFNPFYRAVNTGTVPGSGLGLAVAKRSVEGLGGEISFESREGEGTTFIVKIPIRRGADEKNPTN